MPSAYDSSGRLKKNALRGTAMETDPTMAVERGKFNELHKEAVDQGWDKKQMSAKLTERYGSYNREQQRSLADIAKRKKGFVDEYGALDNEELNADFMRYNDGTRSDEFNARTGREFRDSKKRLHVNLENADKSDIRKWTDHLDKQGKKQGSDAMGWLPQLDSKEYKKWASSRNRKNREAMQKTQWEAHAGLNSQNTEANRVNDAIAKINETFIPLEKNQQQREARLRSRMELYNMFLGQ